MAAGGLADHGKSGRPTLDSTSIATTQKILTQWRAITMCTLFPNEHGHHFRPAGRAVQAVLCRSPWTSTKVAHPSMDQPMLAHLERAQQ